MAEKVYKLYALPATLESVVLATHEKYSRATVTPPPGYVLIYTDGESPKDAQQITEEHKYLLTEADTSWLLECGASILSEEAAKHASDLMQELSQRVEALESELKKRKEELERKGA